MKPSVTTNAASCPIRSLKEVAGAIHSQPSPTTGSTTRWMLWLATLLAVGPLFAAGPPGPDTVRVSPPLGPWILSSPAQPDYHVAALGERAGVWGSLEGGFESWAYPFKLFDGWTLLVAREGESPVDLRSFATRQVATPHLAQLEYAGPDWRLTATWFVPRALPGVLLLLDHVGKCDLDLVLLFRPSLVPMHLKAGGPLAVGWDDSHREWVAREPSRGPELRVRCPRVNRYRALGDEGLQEISFTLPRAVRSGDPVPIGIALSSPGEPDARSILDHLTKNAQALCAEALDHYRQRIAGAPRVETPDPAVNDALVWSVVSLDQLRIRHPDLGYGLVSGYSRSGRGTRPKYCWFFEEPTLTSCAYHWLGMSSQIRESLQFLQQFQRKDGKTVHEIVQSLPYWTNYFQEFPYAYMHSDGPVYYLFAYGDYYRATGDAAFIRAEWPRIRRTLDWCFTAVDPADGLIRIEPGDWGSSESSREVEKDTQLQGLWVRALRDLIRLARLVGEDDLVGRCEQAARRAEVSIQARLWDNEAGFYLWGLDRQGRPLQSLVPHHAVSFWLGSFPTERVVLSLERMACADFRTDWGVRSLAMSDPRYDPKNYQAGSVWPVWNAGVIVADYRHHRSVEAFRTWRAMVRARTLTGLGPMPEVLDGQTFKLLDEGVPHQMFSELAVVNGFFDGLLGLRLDVPSRQIELAPRLPPMWDGLKVDRIPCGPGTLNLRIQRSQTDYRLDVDLDWPGGAHVRLAPELPAGTRLLAASMNGRPVACEPEALPDAVRITLDLPQFSGSCTLRLRHPGGVRWMPVDEPLTPGVTNRNLRVVRARWENNSWRFRLQGLPGRYYGIDFITDRSLATEATDGQCAKHKGGWRVGWALQPNAATNAAGFTEWQGEVRFR